MSSTSSGSSRSNSIQKPRRLSFADPPNEAPHSRSGRKAGNLTRVNFYFTQIKGIPPSWLKQYRVLAQCPDQKCPTSWRASGKPEFHIEEITDSMIVARSSVFVFTIQRRNILGKPTGIGETEPFTLSELEEKQNAQHNMPLELEVRAKGGESLRMTLELNVRTSVAEKPGLPDGMDVARHVFQDYPDLVLETFRCLTDFVPSISDPHRKASYRALLEMVDQLVKYILVHPRVAFSYDMEDHAWQFLKGAAEYLTTYKASTGKAARSQEQFTYLANRLLRGFWSLLQLHLPGRTELDDLQQKFIQQNLPDIRSSSARKAEPKALTPTLLSSRYPRLVNLKGVEMSLPLLQTPGIEHLFHNTAFKEIAGWLADPEIEHNVFWLHGKLEFGSAKNPVAAALLEASKTIGFPVAYFSFSQGATQSPDEHTRVGDMLSSMIYQLALDNSDLTTALHNAVAESTEAFVSLDFFSRFQLLLHSLHSLSLAEQATSFPILLLVDDLEPSNAGAPSPEYYQLLQIFHAASLSTHAVTPASSPAPDSSFMQDISFSGVPAYHRDSLSFPSFLRIVVLSRSLGNDPSLIEQFAFIRDGHRLPGARNVDDKAGKLYNHAVSGSRKGKQRDRISLERGPLIPIAEVNSQTRGK